MPRLPQKLALKDELVRLLTADLETLERAQKAAIEAATHEEAKPENDKDTRALEASYLARGQALRIEELRTGLGEVAAWLPRPFDEDATITLGALVTVEEGEAVHHYLLASHGGGQKLANGLVQVVTPRSPLGRALAGKRANDDCDLVVEGRKRELSITSLE
jgi:transcription elongation GreA/GreB family factor